MRAASLPPAARSDDAPARVQPSRRRAISLGLTIAVHLLLLLMLIRLAPRLTAPPQAQEATTITLEPDRGSAPTQTKAAKEKKRTASGGARATTRAVTKAPPPPTPPAVTEPAGPLKMMVLSQNEFRAADIGAMPRGTSGADSGSASGAGTGEDSGDTAGAGTGPGGEKLYNAEWYREPTQAELATYLPRGVFGWGEVACRTVPGFRVEDCKEIGNEPQGSGLARAVREASFQFRVRPPRIGGKTMVGAWVRIHIDYRPEKAKG